MNPIPVSWCLGGALVAVVTGFAGGWTVRDWKRDSEVLARMETAAKQLRDATHTVDLAATAYEQEKSDAQAQNRMRENIIREIYREQVVPADCAAPDAAVRVLDDAVTAANARAAGEPAPALPKAAQAAGAVDRSGAHGLGE